MHRKRQRSPSSVVEMMEEDVIEIEHITAEVKGRGGPSVRRRRTAYGEEERVAEVDDIAWVKAANDIVAAQLDTNENLANLAKAISALTAEMSASRAEDREDRRAFALRTGELLAEGFRGLEVAVQLRGTVEAPSVSTERSTPAVEMAEEAVAEVAVADVPEEHMAEKVVEEEHCMEEDE